MCLLSITTKDKVEIARILMKDLSRVVDLFHLVIPLRDFHSSPVVKFVVGLFNSAFIVHCGSV